MENMGGKMDAQNSTFLDVFGNDGRKLLVSGEYCTYYWFHSVIAKVIDHSLLFQRARTNPVQHLRGVIFVDYHILDHGKSIPS